MSINFEDESQAFENEISYITNPIAAEFAREVDKEFKKNLKGPSSSSGRYHPRDEFNPSGMIMHCKRVAYWAYELCRENNFSSDTKDAMILAAMIHDISRIKNIYNRHGFISWKMVEEKICDTKFKPIENILIKVKDFSATHMNHWNPTDPQPKTLEDYTFAMADYCASREDVVTPFLKKLK